MRAGVRQGDLVVAAESARFGYPELKAGLTASTVTAQAVHLMGRKIAFELLTLCENLSPQRAYELGMVNRVVPDGTQVDEAMAMGEKLAGWNRAFSDADQRTFHRAVSMGRTGVGDGAGHRGDDGAVAKLVTGRNKIMRIMWFHLMPYTELPDDFRETNPSVWVDIHSSLFDPKRAHLMYNDFMDEWSSRPIRFDAVCVNEHHSNGYGLMPSPNLIASALSRRTTNTAICVMGNRSRCTIRRRGWRKSSR